MARSTLAAPEREKTAHRLLRASASRSFDPLTELDWSSPLPDGLLYLPEERVSLYGTDLWAAMTPQQRIDLSRHEVASLASVGIWFELILMQLLVRYAYDEDPTSRHIQYALTEIADECRHSVMFGRLIERLGCPAYGPGAHAHRLGRFMKTVSSGAEAFAAILIAEEILDTFQREAMTDERVQPLVRGVCRIHVVEEARHVTYAREELARQWAEANPAQRAATRLVVGRAAHVIAGRLVHPGAYAAVGLDPRQARRTAARSPQRAATLQWAAGRLVRSFGELGLIEGPARLLWRRAGLLAA